MLKGFTDLHSTLRWLVLLFLLWTLFKTMSGLNGKRPFTKADKRPALFLLICCDIQLLVGLALYSMKGWFGVLTGGGAMTSNYNRFYSVEHAFGMLVAIIFVHIGYGSIKKNISDGSKFKRVFWFTFIALVLILATIPWPNRPEIGRPLLPGM